MQYCLVCDDHALMRTALAGALRMIWPEARIATASDFTSAAQLAATSPDLILCDLVMAGADPVTGVTQVRKAAPDAKFIVVSGNEEDELLLPLFALGIDGFIAKSASAEVVETAIRLVAAGGRYIPARMVDLARDSGPASESAPQPANVRFTDRQLEVLRLIAQGQANKEIARALDLSPATVKVHAAAIIALLGASNRTEAVFRAREAGVLV